MQAHPARPFSTDPPRPVACPLNRVCGTSPGSILASGAAAEACRAPLVAAATGPPPPPTITSAASAASAVRHRHQDEPRTAPTRIRLGSGRGPARLRPGSSPGLAIKSPLLNPPEGTAPRLAGQRPLGPTRTAR